jgi:cadmium resistance protein CadD (predicted permease)
LAELKAKVPEVYELWIESTRKRTDHEIWQSKKAVRQPYLLASLGQWLGLTAVIGVLVLAGVAVYFGHGVVAGVLGVVDIIGLAAVFNGNQGRRRPPQNTPDQPPSDPQPQ